jgi:hypothetical protein
MRLAQQREQSATANLENNDQNRDLAKFEELAVPVDEYK